MLSKVRKYSIAKKIAKKLHPEIHVGAYGKTWQQDKQFLQHVAPFDHDPDSLERKFMLYQLLKLTNSVPGISIEFGAYKGSSSYTICSALKRRHIIIDSFEGLSQPTDEFDENKYWKRGDLFCSEQELKNNLFKFSDIIKVYKGFISIGLYGSNLHSKINEYYEGKFCFAHIDVDLYYPTFFSLEFIYPKMAKGGIILFDDYGFLCCKGARLAIQNSMVDRSEPIIELTTGQCFIVKE